MKFFVLVLFLIPATVSAQQGPFEAQKRLLGTRLDTIVLPQFLLNAPADSNMHGKFKVFEFWATWCVPCLKAVPHINKLQKEFEGENIAFLSVTNESAEKTASTFKKVSFETIVVSDPDRKLQRQLRILYEGSMVIPRTALVDDHNRIIWFGHPNSLTKKLIRKFLDRELE